MKHFEKAKLNKNDYKVMEKVAVVVRFVLTPVFLLIRIYCWVWDYDYYKRFKHPELMD